MASQDAADASGRVRLTRFFTSRWRGEVPLGILFWRDMVCVATAISLAVTLAAVALLGLGFPLPVVLAVNFSPLPYNLFLFAAVWRACRGRVDWPAQVAPLGSAVWLIVATLI